MEESRKEVTIFSNGHYRKYMIANNHDKDIKRKIQKAFAEMEELIYSNRDCIHSLGDDLGKCAICFKAFEEG